MPAEFAIDKSNDILLRKVSGEVSPGEIMASLAESISHPDYHPGMRSLIDMRGFVSKSKYTDIRQLAGFLSEHVDAIKGMQAAVVVSRVVDYGLTRMMQALVDSPDFSIAVFYDIDEAKKWLGAVSSPETSPPAGTTTGCASARRGRATAA